jgi:hypothetical protein
MDGMVVTEEKWVVGPLEITRTIGSNDFTIHFNGRTCSVDVKVARTLVFYYNYAPDDVPGGDLSTALDMSSARARTLTKEALTAVGFALDSRLIHVKQATYKWVPLPGDPLLTQQKLPTKTHSYKRWRSMLSVREAVELQKGDMVTNTTPIPCFREPACMLVPALTKGVVEAVCHYGEPIDDQHAEEWARVKFDGNKTLETMTRNLRKIR